MVETLRKENSVMITEYQRQVIDNMIPIVVERYGTDVLALSESLADTSLLLYDLLKDTAWSKQFKHDYAIHQETIWLAWELLYIWETNDEYYPEAEDFLAYKKIDLTKGE